MTPEQKLQTLNQRSRDELKQRKAQREAETADALAAEMERISIEENWEKHAQREKERRRKREELEREEALKGEKHWVRQGGILRDADGRRDYKRTDEIRKIVEREDSERRIIERWKAYEHAWADMISSVDKPVTFASLPWPVLSPPKSIEDLRDPTNISNFIFESLSLHNNRTTHRDRIRASLLRWHPDKLGSVLARVPESEIDAVKDGVDAVVIGLMKLQEAEKARS